MNRSVAIALTIIVLIGVLFFFFNRRTKAELIWYPTYDYQRGQQPFDLDVFIDLCKKDIGEKAFTRIDKPFSDYNLDTNNLYVAIQSNFLIDSIQNEALMRFVENGNSAFISAENFGAVLKDFLADNIDGFEEMSGGNLTYINPLAQDSCRVTLIDSSLDFYIKVPNITQNWYPYRGFIFNSDINKVKHLASSSGGIGHLISFEYGKGKIILHSMPVAFTNYVLRKRPAFDYSNYVINQMQFDSVFWDELQFESLAPENQEDKEIGESAFKHIFANRSLRFAFYLTFFGVIIFILLAARRRKPAIPIVEDLTNSSVTFSKTIARLYWLHPNHKKMAEKKMKFFLSEVRNRYQLDTSTLSDDFVLKLSNKSGLETRHLNRLIGAYKLVTTKDQIHRDLLMQIAQSIVYIRNNWK